MPYHDDISKLIWIQKTSAHGIKRIEFLWERESEREKVNEYHVICQMTLQFLWQKSQICSNWHITNHFLCFSLFSSNKMLFFRFILTFLLMTTTAWHKNSLFCYIINVIYWSNFLLLFSSFFFSFNLVMTIFLEMNLKYC